MMAVLKRLVKLMLPYWKPMTLGLILSFLTIGSNMGLLITSAYLISWSALRPPVLDLMVLVAGVRFFGISRAAFRYGERYVTHHATLAILGKIRVWVYHSLAAQSPGRLLSYHSGQLLSRLVNDVEALKDLYLRVLLPPFTAFLIGLGAALFLGRFHWSLVVVFVLFYTTAALGVPWLVRRLTGGKEKLDRAREELNTLLADSLKGLTEITAFGREKLQIDKATGKGNAFARLQLRISTGNALTGTLTQLLANLAMVATLCLSVHLVSLGQFQGIWIAALTMGVLAAFEAVHGLSRFLPNLEENLAAGERVFKLVDAPLPPKKPDHDHRPSTGGEVTIRNLTFTYPGADRPVLKNIDFHLPAGGRLAIVGPSGAGKSTVAQLLLGFWDYREGSVLLDGKEVKAFSEDNLWSTIGLVSRQTYLFNATVRENLLLAKPDATEEELLEASERVQLLPHLASLPKGWDTLIGEGGWKLSGGQRQLVALARTFLKNPAILVLDEATEGLDPITEKQVLAAIKQLMKGRTTIMITHRLIGLEDMDEILVLNRGEIVERGTHEELSAQGGLYQSIYWQR